MTQEKDVRNSMVNFGKSGWALILYCAALFYFFAGIVNDGMNVVAPAAAENIGVQSGTVLIFNAIASLIALAIYLLIAGRLIKRIGAKRYSTIALIVAAVAYVILGQARNPAVYLICMCIAAGFVMSNCYMAGGELVNRWFPTRKGVVMGWTTMGLNTASATYVLMMTPLTNRLSLHGSVFIPAIMMVIIAILGAFVIKDDPFDKGKYPDNVSKEIYEKEYYQKATLENEDEDNPWTVGKLLTTKEVWTCGVATGMFQLATTGVVSQLVNRNVELGMTPARAVYIMTVVALIGLLGSFLIGVMDQKIGTKRAMIIFACIYAAAMLINATNTRAGLFISVVMIGVGIGGSANFMTSWPTSVFGRRGYDLVQRVVFPIQAAVTAIAFFIDGAILNATGSLRLSFVIFAIICLAVCIPVLISKDHRFNDDWKIAHGEETQES